jgi:hypothetical protein
MPGVTARIRDRSRRDPGDFGDPARLGDGIPGLLQRRASSAEAVGLPFDEWVEISRHSRRSRRRCSRSDPVGALGPWIVGGAVGRWRSGSAASPGYLALYEPTALNGDGVVTVEGRRRDPDGLRPAPA